MAAGPFSFTHPALLGAALAAWAVAAVALVVRRGWLPPASRALVGFGAVLLCTAAGGMTWRRPLAQGVEVMVDLSASTRSADYRHRAAVDARIRQLLGATPYHVTYFAEEARDVAPGGEVMADLPGERTVYPPPPAAAVLLFSDGRFAPPPLGGPPTYPVLDPGLVRASDAAVEGLEVRGADVAVRVRNGGGSRRLTLNGASGPSPTTAPAGAFVITQAAEPGASVLSAALSPGDLWPENDALSAPPPPPERAERWFVGDGAPRPGWRTLAPRDLPTDPTAWLAPAVVILSDVPAAALSIEQQDRLRQYVRDLGGGVVILGGPHAFAAGGYSGSGLDALSPLASTPPRPTTHWMLLADSSGSMGGAPDGGGATRWQFAADAIVRALPHLPPDDVASVGSFAESLTWWTRGRPVKETQAIPLPPPTVRPTGPTNLRPVLDTIAEQAEPALPKQLLLLTDADAEVGEADSLAAGLKAKNIHLSLLAIGDGRGLPALRRVVEATGGRLVEQADAARWASAVRELAQAAGPKFLESSPLSVGYKDELSNLPARNVSPWNRTWLKKDAGALADSAETSAETVHPVARWSVGEGRVAAASFAATPAEVEQFASLVDRPPADPRYRATWEAGPELRVTIDAQAGDRYLNDQSLTLELTSDDSVAGAPRPVPQTAPGRYELSVPAPRRPAFATIRAAGRVLARTAVAGRYAPEFDAIGVDREALRTQAERTGAYVVDLTIISPIDFHWPPRETPLSAWLAAGGALLIAAGLVWWRMT